MSSSPKTKSRSSATCQSWVACSGVRLKNADGSAGDFFVVPGPIDFQPFTYSDANHAYRGNENPNKNGSQFTDLRYDGWGLMGIEWAMMEGRKDQWGNDMWAPEITLRRGVELVAANSTGSVTAGDKIIVAPAFTELTPKTVNDCSAEVKSRAESAPSTMELPGVLEDAKQQVKASISTKPKNNGGEELKVRIVDGKAS